MKDFYSENKDYIQMKQKIMKLDLSPETKLDLLHKLADVACAGMLHGMESSRVYAS